MLSREYNFFREAYQNMYESPMGNDSPMDRDDSDMFKQASDRIGAGQDGGTTKGSLIKLASLEPKIPSRYKGHDGREILEMDAQDSGADWDSEFLYNSNANPREMNAANALNNNFVADGIRNTQRDLYLQNRTDSQFPNLPEVLRRNNVTKAHDLPNNVLNQYGYNDEHTDSENSYDGPMEFSDFMRENIPDIFERLKDMNLSEGDLERLGDMYDLRNPYLRKGRLLDQ